MSKKEFDKIIAEAMKKPTTEDVIRKLTGEPKPKKPSPVQTTSKRSKLKKNFLKQIEEYNDFLIQNDLDVEKIDPKHDYDFSAFKSSKDWAAESERLADRLKDRQAEIKQNEDAGEFEGLELENGVPSYEAMKNMSPEQYKAFEAKYLTPSTDEFKEAVVEAPGVAETVTPEGSGIIQDAKTGEVLAESGKPVAEETTVVEPVVETVVSDKNDTNTSSERKTNKHKISIPRLEAIIKDKNRDIDPITLAKNSLPYPVKSALDSALEAVKSGNRVVTQGRPLDALQDVGRGIMSGLSGTTADVLDIGGLIKNEIANEARKSAHWWEDQFEIPNSEAGQIGSKIGDEAVAGLAGGALGKVAGNAYRHIKLGGEALRRDATKAAEVRQALADDHTDYAHKFLKSIGYPSNVSKGKISAEDALMTRQNVYENLTRKLPSKPLNSDESLVSTLIHNAKRELDKRSMLQRNDKEINKLFNQGNTLDDALRIQQNRWNKYPDTARDAGLLMGVAVGE